MRFTTKQEAFTLMEIMIVSIIIASMAMMFGRIVIKRWARIKIDQTNTQLALIKGDMIEYYADKGRYPKSMDDLIPYLDKTEVPHDPWNEELIYNSPPVRYKKSEGYKQYELYSTGPDKEESDDDIHTGE